MINKLISKTQVRLLEYDGNPSDDYKQGYIRAIQDVLDLDTVPTLGVDEIEKIRTEIDKQEKWLLQAGYTAYNVDIAFDAIKSVVAESEE